MSVTFRYAGPDEYPRVSRFINDYWAKDHIYVRDQPLFEWTFRRPGHWSEPGFSVALAEDGECVAGVLGGIPFTFNRFGEQSSGVWIVNYVIHPDYRKGATALKLLSMFRRPEYHAVIAFGINPATATIYRVLRGEVLPLIPRCFSVLPGQEERMKTFLALAYPAWPVERIQALTAFFASESYPDAPVMWRTRIPEEWDRCDWPAFARETVGAARDGSYLKWRYLDHPIFDYRVISVQDGGRSGLLVWRQETIRQQTEDGRRDVDRIARIVEFLPTSAGNARELLGALYETLRTADVFAVDHYGYHGSSRAWLEEAGLRDASGHCDGALVPSRFQPLDGKGGGIMSAVFLNGEFPKCDGSVSCPWYWTKSDSDMDRPN